MLWQLSFLGNLNAGVFWTAAHARFDLTKTGLCRRCGEPDSQEHWLACPIRLLRAECGWVVRPSCYAPACASWSESYFAMAAVYFTRLDPGLGCFGSATSGWQHVFIDGSCSGAKSPVPYAAYLANADALLGAGHVPGVVQQVLECFADCPSLRMCSLHWEVPDSCNAHEDWLHEFNDKVDRAASQINRQRPELFCQHREEALAYHTTTSHHMRCLENFSLASARTSTTECDPEAVLVEGHSSLSDLCPVDLNSYFALQYRGTLPAVFVQSVLTWIRTEEDSSAGVYNCSFLSLFFFGRCGEVIFLTKTGVG